MFQQTCDLLESALRRSDGPPTILVVGGRMSGKTSVCETVMKRLNRHVIRWTPYEQFVVGDVSTAFSHLDTIVFIDDADVLVRLTKGSSVGLIDAIEACKLRPHLRVVMTALDAKGRVWKPVANSADLVHRIPDGCVTDQVNCQSVLFRARAVKSSDKDSWGLLLQTTERAVSAKLMNNWCDRRETDEDGVYDGDDDVENLASDNERCIIRMIARTLVSTT